MLLVSIATLVVLLPLVVHAHLVVISEFQARVLVLLEVGRGLLAYACEGVFFCSVIKMDVEFGVVHEVGDDGVAEEIVLEHAVHVRVAHELVVV